VETAGAPKEQREEGFLQRCREVVAFLRCSDGLDKFGERGDLQTSVLSPVPKPVHGGAG